MPGRVKKKSTSKSKKSSPKIATRRRRPPRQIPFIDVPTGSVEAIPIDDIDLESGNARQFMFRINLRVGKLADSIREDGQQIPVILRRRAGTGKLQVVSGFRRITAIKKLGWDTVNAVVREDLQDDGEAVKVSVIENEMRQTYNDLDRAYAIIAYRNLGKSNREIEQLFKVGERQRQRLQELTTFPKTLQEAIADDDANMDATKAVRLMQHARKHPDTDIDGWIKRVDDEELTQADLSKALRESIAEEKRGQPVEFFVKWKKNGQESLRVRPITIDAGMTKKQRASLVEDLKWMIEFVEGLQ